MQAKESDDINVGDDNLSSSVEDLNDPTKNPLDPNDNIDGGKITQSHWIP